MVMARKSGTRKILENSKTQTKMRKTWMKIWKMKRKTSYWPSWKVDNHYKVLIGERDLIFFLYLMPRSSRENFVSIIIYHWTNATRCSLEREILLRIWVALLATILNIMFLFCLMLTLIGLT